MCAVTTARGAAALLVGAGVAQAESKAKVEVR